MPHDFELSTNVSCEESTSVPYGANLLPKLFINKSTMIYIENFFAHINLYVRVQLARFQYLLHLLQLEALLMCDTNVTAAKEIHTV